MKKLLSVFLSACLAFQGLPLGTWALEVFESVETAEEIPFVTREEVEASLSEAAFTDKEWTGQDETSQIFAINREKARVDSIPYASLEAAITGAVDYNKSLSPYYQKLSGKNWNVYRKFYFSESQRRCFSIWATARASQRSFSGCPA